jgi:hypothetical protein
LQCMFVYSEMSSVAPASSAQRQYSFKKRSSVGNVGKGKIVLHQNSSLL